MPRAGFRLQNSAEAEMAAVLGGDIFAETTDAESREIASYGHAAARNGGCRAEFVSVRQCVPSI